MANLRDITSRWHRSGLTQRAFCTREGIKLSTFTYWRSKKLREAGEVHSGAAFTEVRLDPLPALASERVADRSIEIRYPDGTLIRIPLPLPA